MATNRLFAPNRASPIVDRQGMAIHGAQVFFEEIERILTDTNANVANLTPVYVSKDNSDSPYSASDMEYVLADMSAGDLTIVLPSSGRVWVSRKGASNTLTIQGTVNGTVDPTINFDGTAVAMAYISTEWRFV